MFNYIAETVGEEEVINALKDSLILDSTQNRIRSNFLTSVGINGYLILWFKKMRLPNVFTGYSWVERLSWHSEDGLMHIVKNNRYITIQIHSSLITEINSNSIYHRKGEELKKYCEINNIRIE